jgi:alkanesulfonate monooxygenase SsuD/methylene tetrahydromethanopterin reductase-like flavin-dependent oxidoreductase (luciferase family)
MRFGLYAPNFGVTGDVRLLVELAERADAAGWDGFFLWDHLVSNHRPHVDPWVVLGAVAPRTDRIVLGPMIVPLARRRPQKVAVEVAALSELAPERLRVGVGLGAPIDFTTFDEDADWRVRADKFERALETMQLDVPVWVSGEWPRRQPFHGAAHADGAFPIGENTDGRARPLTPPQVGEARETLPERARRDFAIWRNDTGEHELEAYERAGVTWWMVECWGLPPDELRRLADAGPHRFVRANPS